ncbi:YfgM family protein [Rubrivivax rivuli]|uniref:Ancillary SecYEG translocon subunit n=1 Tax=Rubrivivax rivuli TaxID=1862385 RepID=A0A437RFC4_9BURK|nr:tetratricopeptide repeat protein [Rubrivivax rivuli]RVU45467.1 tetratricopeptide repeat protein [Rubrivivax rivuli]
MATQLDLQEQEQLDALKSFWKKQGNLITWTLVLVLGGFAAWNGWNFWQRDQGVKAGAMFEELDRAAAAGDAEKTARVFADMRQRFPKAPITQQGGLTAAKVQVDKGQSDAAKASLTWVAENGVEDEMRTIARLRLAAVLADAKQFDEGLKVLDAATAPEFTALVADRRGDLFMAQGKKAEARTAWQAAYAAMDPKLDYRRLVEAKLGSIGAAPGAAPAAAASAASGASK